MTTKICDGKGDREPDGDISQLIESGYLLLGGIEFQVHQFLMENGTRLAPEHRQFLAQIRDVAGSVAAKSIGVAHRLIDGGSVGAVCDGASAEIPKEALISRSLASTDVETSLARRQVRSIVMAPGDGGHRQRGRSLRGVARHMCLGAGCGALIAALLFYVLGNTGGIVGGPGETDIAALIEPVISTAQMPELALSQSTASAVTLVSVAAPTRPARFDPLPAGLAPIASKSAPTKPAALTVVAHVLVRNAPVGPELIEGVQIGPAPHAPLPVGRAPKGAAPFRVVPHGPSLLEMADLGRHPATVGHLGPDVSLLAGTVAAPPHPDAEATAEARLELSQRGRREVQRRLALVAFDPGLLDGIFGPATRSAIMLWQKKIGIPATGYLDEIAFALLVDESEDDYRRWRLVKQARGRRLRARTLVLVSPLPPVPPGRGGDCQRSQSGKVVYGQGIGCDFQGLQENLSDLFG